LEPIEDPVAWEKPIRERQNPSTDGAEP
jgi:hypothetical protein